MKVLWSSKVFCTSNYVSFLILDSLEKKNYNSGLSLRFQVSRYIQPVGRKANNQGFFGFLFFFYCIDESSWGSPSWQSGETPNLSLEISNAHKDLQGSVKCRLKLLLLLLSLSYRRCLTLKPFLLHLSLFSKR